MVRIQNEKVLCLFHTCLFDLLVGAPMSIKRRSVMLSAMRTPYAERTASAVKPVDTAENSGSDEDLFGGINHRSTFEEIAGSFRPVSSLDAASSDADVHAGTALKFSEPLLSA